MKKEKMLILILIPSLLLALFGSTTLSSPTTRIYVNPPTTTATVAGNFTVDINIQDVTDLNAWQVWLRWDPQVLNITLEDIVEGDFLRAGGSTVFVRYANFPSEGHLFVISQLFEGAGVIVPGVDGSGTLASITFSCIGLGESTLELYDTKLFNSAPLVTDLPLGDGNGDGTVDIFDQTAVAAAIGSSLGDSRYDQEADMNKDGHVDVYDQICIVFNWNHLYPGDSGLDPQEIGHEVDDGYAIVYPSTVKEDLNGDGAVNMVDIATVGEAYASRPGDPSWNPLCDLMRDSVIDWFDASMVARMFGWSNGAPISPKPVEWKLNITIDHLVRGVESHIVTIFSDYIVYSNYTFDHLNAELIFDVTSSIDAFCNFTIPRGLLNGAFRVELDNVAAPSILTWNGTHTWIYFTSTQLSHRVKIVGLTPGDVTAVPGETQPIVDIFDVVFVSTHFEDPLRYIDVYLGPHFY